MQLIIDPLTGLAGDMMIAALLDAGAEHEEVMRVVRFAAELLGRAEIVAESVRHGSMMGTRLRTSYRHDRSGMAAEVVREHLRRVQDEFSFTSEECGVSEKTLDVLCRAEAAAHARFERESHDHHDHAHQHAPAPVHLHEAQDILVDICGTVRALRLLRVNLSAVTCLSPVRCGGGTITFSHGTFPAPAPATRTIIAAHKIPTEEGPVSRELLTPTGAALLAALAPRYALREKNPVLPDALSGTGWGSLVFDESVGLANGLRLYLQKG